MKKVVFIIIVLCLSMLGRSQWYLSTDTIPLYPYLHYGVASWPWASDGSVHDGMVCQLAISFGLPDGTCRDQGLLNWGVKRHASDTIRVVGLAVDSDNSCGQILERLSLYDSNMTLLKTTGLFYNLGENASSKDTQVHWFHVKPLPVAGRGWAAMTFVYFDDGPIDIIGDYYISATTEYDRNTYIQCLGEYHHNQPPYLIREEWVRNITSSNWTMDTTRWITLTFPIITPKCDAMGWATAAMEGDSVVRVQWDSAADEVQVCIIPYGESPDSSWFFVKDTAGFDTVVARGDYDVYVRRVCNERYDVHSVWTGPISLLAPCEPPEVTMTVNDSCVLVSWSGTRRPCEVSVVAAGEEPGVAELCTEQEYMRCGLQPTGEYDVYIRLVCDTSGGRSTWGGPYSLTMPRYGIEEAGGLARGMRLTPNPARATVRLTVEGMRGLATVTVTDAAGREAARYAMQDGWLDIDVSRLPKGTYMVSVTTAEGTGAKALVVQ